jgi:hypothetical protein
MAILCSIVFGGVSRMMKYGNIRNQVEYNLENLHFFIRVDLARLLQKITAEELPENTTLPSFHIFIDERDLESLEEDLPASAKLQYKKAHVTVNKPSLSSEAKIRYRGGLDLHWLYEKKSIRVKLPPFTTYRNERQFDLVNPTTIRTIVDWISYDMARSIGLLTPEYFPARVYINHESNGLHYFLSGINESFLRKNNRMPGSIYSGDSLYFVNPYVKRAGKGEIVFKGEDGVALLWKDYRLWTKDASRNAESSTNQDELKRFFKILYEPDPLEFMHAFDTFFDKQKFYNFWGLDRLVGNYHHDLFHNHRLYFDPYKGKFEPIEWDLRFWSIISELPVTPLYKQILLNPLLKYEVDLTVYELREKFNPKYVSDMIDEANNKIVNELAADPYRHHPDGNNKQFGVDKVVPFSMDEYLYKIEETKHIYFKRLKHVDQELNLTVASYLIEELSENESAITIAISGNSPIDYDPWLLVPESSHEDIKIFRIYADNSYPVLNNGELDRLYPGIKIVENSEVKRVMPLSISVYGPYSYPPSPLYYRYLIKGMNSSHLIKLDKLTGNNSITSNIVSIEHVEDLPDDDLTLSLHPWRLLPQDSSINNNIVLSGVINVTEDLIFTEKQKVTILPGTIFKLSKNCSIFFYGQVIAKGTAALPIKFERKNKDQFWSSIVIQGKEASGSHLSYIDVSGGSVSQRNLINYPGQLNIHDVDSFELEHCYISNNSIGDDALHIAYSSGNIQDCEFKNIVFDALDMDIVNVSVSDSKYFNIGNDAIDLMNSKTMISNVNIVGSGDKCISVGEASQVTIENSHLENCEIGIAVKDSSIAQLENIEFSIRPGHAIELYLKNSRYSAGGEIDGNQLYGITEKDIIVRDFSVNNLQKSAYLPSRNH